MTNTHGKTIIRHDIKKANGKPYKHQRVDKYRRMLRSARFRFTEEVGLMWEWNPWHEEPYSKISIFRFAE